VRNIAIVGAGQTGASAALALTQQGVEVTLYSDREREQLRNFVPPTGSAIIFGKAQAAEAHLGLPAYLDAPKLTGMSDYIVVPPGLEAFAFDAEFSDFTAVGVDPRLKADDRIGLFLDLGGDFVVQKVDVDALDDIAHRHDLTLVATGKGGLSSLFPRDDRRSFYSSPQRVALMLTAKGPPPSPSLFAHRSPAGASHAAFSVIEGVGEFWTSPYYHKDNGPSWTLLAWAVPGGEWETRIRDASNPDTTLEIMRQIHVDYLPWDLPELESFEVIAEDPFSWLRGSVLQEVRAGLGYTKSRHVVGSLGDTSIGYDPLAGQGAQSGLLQAALYVDRIIEHEAEFGSDWITDSFEMFYHQRGQAAEMVTRMFLGAPELSEIAQILVGAANGSERAAAGMFNLISDPQPLLSMHSAEDAKAYVSRVSSEEADVLLARSSERMRSAETNAASGRPHFKRSGHLI
jgi:2-polyprenyl-6-methoxyphenol hydroxylase-like FAD-dependent oxidoreductase